MKKYIFSLLSVILLGLLPGCSEKTQRPNVLFILTDQWRASALGYNGNKTVQTPNLDEFASETVNFSNTVSVCPVCTPYRASLLTGKYPTSTGMFLNDIYLPSEELCMAEIYNEAGYNTAYLGKWHLDGHGRLVNVDPERRQGFSFWKGLECSHDYNHMAYYENEDPEIKYWQDYSPFAISKEAQNYMENHAKDKDPFLLFVSIATPHFPHHSAPQKYRDMYPLSELTLNENVPAGISEEVYKELQGYYAHCSASDQAIGDLIKKAKELDIYKNTIIVFTSDHGEMMGAHGRYPFRKQLAWDEASRVPFLIHYPGLRNEDCIRMKAPITTPDILPSLLGLCGLDIPGSIEGNDLSSLIKNPDPAADRAALYMNVYPFDVNYEDTEYRAIRTAKYTYAKSPEKAFMLFDNEKDPLQLNNLVDNPEYNDIKTKLDQNLRQELEKIDDADFKSREYYLNKFGMVINAETCIKYRFEKGKPHIVQSPKIQDKKSE